MRMKLSTASVMRDCVTERPADVPEGAIWCQRGCGDWWLTDPRLLVPCPTCRARAGSKCKRPSEHETAEPHAARKQLAWATHPCRCLAIWDAEHAGDAPAPGGVAEPEADLQLSLGVVTP